MSIPANGLAPIVLMLIAAGLASCQVSAPRSLASYPLPDCVANDQDRDCYVALFASDKAIAERDPRGFPQHYLELWDEALRQSECAGNCAAMDLLSSYFNPYGRPLRDELGVALEGGGNKSGPFTLGVLAGLQEMDLLQTKVTAISSVSGGSYAASFYYNRLFDLHPPSVAQVTKPRVDEEADKWFRSCIPDYFLRNGKLMLSGIYANTPQFPGCGEVDESGLFRPFDSKYAYQEQVWMHHDVLRLVNAADYRTNESLHYPQFANLTALALATAATVPFQFVARSLFRWPVNSAPSKAAYKAGIERQYGYAPSDWAAARSNETTPIWVQSTERRRKRTLANLAVNVPPDHMPQWIIVVTAPGYISGTQWLGAMPRDPIRQQFEISPLGFGSGTYGYAMAFPDAPFDITGPNPEGLPIVDAVVASAAFFDDNQLLISKQPLRFLGAAGQQFANVDWFSEIRNFRTDDDHRRHTWLEPYPIYLQETTRGPMTPYIHLQDGGNAENSGILPLLRRGYRRIVYAHGTTDEDAGFAAICHLKNQLEYDGKYYIVSEDLERLVRSLDPTRDEAAAKPAEPGQVRFRSYLDQLCTLQIDRSDLVAFDDNEGRKPERKAQPVAKLLCGRLGLYRPNSEPPGRTRADPDPQYEPCEMFKERFPTKHTDTPPCSNCAHPSIPTNYTVSTHLFYRSSASPLRLHVCRGDVLDRDASAPHPKPADWDGPLSTIIAVVPALPVTAIAEQVRSTPPWIVNPKDPWDSFCTMPRDQMQINACTGPDGSVLSAAGVADPDHLARKGLPCTALAHVLEDRCHHETRAHSDILHPIFPQNDLVLETLHSTYLAYAAYFDLGRYQVRRALTDVGFLTMDHDDDPQQCAVARDD